MYEVYSKPNCGYCVKAKALLENKGIPYVERILDVGQDKIPGYEYYTKEELLAKFPGVTTLPQITYFDDFDDEEQSTQSYTITEQHIGGYTQLGEHLAKQGV